MSKTIEISRELAQKVDDLLYILTGHDSHPKMIRKYGEEFWIPIDQLRAELCTALATPAVERKSAPVVGMLIDGVVHHFKDEHLVSESGAIVPEADELYRKSSAVERQDVLPCDVRVAPATTIKKGCKVETLMQCIELRKGQPDKFTRFENSGPPAPVAVMTEKYDDVLVPFLALMRKELHANSGKGDRPGWLAMSSDTALLEIIYHFGKLQASVKRGDEDGIREYAADVANMCMMLVDICACIYKVEEMNK